jgi:hypothetical protein
MARRHLLSTEKSSDLRDVALRYYEATSKGDESFMDRAVSSQREVLIIGTDPDEWWAKPAVINRTLKEQARAGVKVVPGDLLAYREGSVGWIADRARFVSRDGREAAFRWTAVFRQEAGQWKLVQGHCSIGVPNEEMFARAPKASSRRPVQSGRDAAVTAACSEARQMTTTPSAG